MHKDFFQFVLFSAVGHHGHALSLRQQAKEIVLGGRFVYYLNLPLRDPILVNGLHLPHPGLLADGLVQAAALAVQGGGEEGTAVAVQQRVNWPLGDETAVIQNRHRVAHLLHVVQNMGGVKDSRVLAQPFHDCQDVAPP